MVMKFARLCKVEGLNETFQACCSSSKCFYNYICIQVPSAIYNIMKA